MAAIPSLSKIKDWIFSSKKRSYGIGLALLLFLALFSIRGCSTPVSFNNSYTIAQDVRWMGLNLMGKERNLSAFNVDLLATIAKLENMRIQLSSIQDDNNAMLAKLENGEVQGIISTMQPTPINQNAFVFSDPYFLLGPVLIISKGAPVKGWNEMSRKIVGVQSNSPAILDLEKDPSIQIKLYDNILRAMADLDDQRIDGIIFPVVPASIYTKTFYEGRLKIATPPLNNEGLRLVALKNPKGEQLIKSFNQALKTIKADGLYDRLLERWGLMNAEKVEG
ncbi:substrate-binding periplasmic protein [Candidatus Protochlamydia phocaeensis]|uniref:substrate-binding periplasmic protein n=1 Tax=Candidatus Protochlamydia phocaeensis TaxID=1414722 RepID=UPI000838673B|nr:ABC transporter substrate-binding protein [Candidatus Protochlamydia phocaeensis]